MNERKDIFLQEPLKKKIKIIDDLSTVVNSNANNDDATKAPQSPSDSEAITKHEIHKANGFIETATEVPQISKKQRKKMQKLKEYEEKKKEKRLKEREKCKQKKVQALSKGLPTRTGPSRKELKRNKMQDTKNFLKVAIDLDFDDFMIEKDICKCIKQLLRIYTMNRRCETPCTLYFSGIKEQGRIHKVLERHEGWENWDVQWHFKPYTEILEKEKIVYLTSDSDNVLNKLEEDIVYVVGGLVDHNHHKGLCYERAQKLGLRTARLPLSEHVDLKTRSVLSTVHVFEIILKISQGKQWCDAIIDSLPMRKGAKPKCE